MVDQLLREWPPGYGGIERVAHELAVEWGGNVYSLNAQPSRRLELDPLNVEYIRKCVPRLAIGRLLLPLPSFEVFILLASTKPLHGHLPSPGVLLLLVIARLIQPRRRITVHWHCFLEKSPGISGLLYSLYQSIALKCMPFFSTVVVTSPNVASHLESLNPSIRKIYVLPCSLSPQQENDALNLPSCKVDSGSSLRVLFIGRLDSYKRVDWLLSSLAEVDLPWTLNIIGDGPKRQAFQKQANNIFLDHECVFFHGRVSETIKLQILENSDVLVLPSESCNEAFGIVQLEAMAAGTLSLAFDREASGMGWVSRLPDLVWPQTPESLADVLRKLALDKALCCELGIKSREKYMSYFSRSLWLTTLKKMF